MESYYVTIFQLFQVHIMVITYKSQQFSVSYIFSWYQYMLVLIKEPHAIQISNTLVWVFTNEKTV